MNKPNPQKANVVHFSDPEDYLTALCDHPAPAFLIEPGEAQVKALAVHVLCPDCQSRRSE